MLRPSRPMIRPFRSSLGRSTTDTVVSIACSAALRWIACVMICLALAFAPSRASASSRLTRLAASRLASVFDLPKQDIFGFVRRQAGDPLKLTLVLRDELLVPREGGRCCLLSLGHGSLTGSQLRVHLSSGGLTCGDGLRVLGQLLLECRDLLAPVAHLVIGLQQQLMSLLFGGQQHFLVLGFGLALGIPQDPLSVLRGSADGLGDDSLADGDPN